MKTLFIIALRNLWKSGKRTALLGSAIGSVTLLLVLLSSVGNGMYDTILTTATALTTGHVNVAGFYKITSGQAAPVVTEFKPLLKDVKELVPPGSLVVDRLRGWGKIVSHKSSIQVGIGGVDIEQEKAFSDVIQLAAGDLNGLREPNTVLLFEGQAKRLGVSVGESLTLTAPTVRGAQNSADVRLVAIAKPVGLLSGFNIFVSKEVLRDIYLLKEGSTGALQIYIEDPEQAEEISENLRAELMQRGHPMMEPLAKSFWQKFPLVSREPWVGQKLDVTNWRDELNFLTWTLDAIGGLTFALVSILLTIIVVGVLNALWVAIRERTKEIGTLRAIGMQRHTVLTMIVIEAGCLAVFGSILGAIAGVGATALINEAAIPLSDSFQIFLMRDTLRLLVDMPTLATSVALISVITTLFALFPAYRATKLPPITAIHDIG